MTVDPSHDSGQLSSPHPHVMQMFYYGYQPSQLLPYMLYGMLRYLTVSIISPSIDLHNLPNFNGPFMIRFTYLGFHDERFGTLAVVCPRGNIS